MPALLVLALIVGSIFQYGYAENKDPLQAIADHAGCDYEDLLNSAELRPGDSTSDWIAITSGCSDKPVRSKHYLKGLEEEVSRRYAENGGLDRIKSTEWHRISLAVAALGGDPTSFGKDKDGKPINLIADGTYNWKTSDSLGLQGLNGWIFALITLDSLDYEVPKDAKYSRETIIENLVQEQAENGSFSLAKGGQGDVDITAMTLQALAPYYKKDDRVTKTVDKALTWLSQAQTKDGDFLAWQEANSESTAQTIIALCSLGIDPKTDSRFTKADSTIMDGLLRYRTSSGMFKHILDGKEDYMATYQAALALIADQRLEEGQPRLYDLKNVVSYEEKYPEKASNTMLYIIAGLAGLIVIAVLIIVSKRRKKENVRDNG